MQERPVASGVDAVRSRCPYCGASVDLLVDPGGGAEQRYVEDCEICCRPWSVTVRWTDAGPAVDLRTEDDP
jgi:transposase-like protein